jgi:hypothetical protein
MAGFADVIEKGIAIAKDVTATLQAGITIEPWDGQDAQAMPSYDTAVAYDAIVDMTAHLIRDSKGEDVLAKATITILEPISDNGAAGRLEPVDPRDLITLPDGSTNPILNIQGLVNPDTDSGYMFVITLGFGATPYGG